MRCRWENKIETRIKDERFDVRTVMKVLVVVFWVVMQCSVAVGYQRFEGLSASILTLITFFCNIPNQIYGYSF
jgi:hypothetical protein